MKKHFDIKIFGDVQGRFFRGEAKAMANRFSITGTVKNEPDGTVYIEAEGLEGYLQNFLAWCKAGPAEARVIKTEVQESSLKNYEGFQIIY